MIAGPFLFSHLTKCGILKDTDLILGEVRSYGKPPKDLKAWFLLTRSSAQDWPEIHEQLAAKAEGLA